MNSKSVFLLLCVILILTFLWRAFTPAHEYPGQSVMLTNMVFDVVCLGCVIWFWIVLPAEFRASGVVRVLCLAGVVAGVGLFVVRLHNKDSWYTGHWSYYLEERR